MPVARVVLEPTIDNPDAPPMMLDVPVDEGGNPVGKRLLFGFDEEPNERYAQLDLLESAIEEGRLVRLYSVNYGEQTYRVTRLMDLLSG